MAANQKFHISTIFKAVDKFSGPVAKMSTRFGQFTRKMKKGMAGIRRMTGRVARGVKGLGISFATMAIVGGFALKGLFGPAARFEQAMAGINAVTLGSIKNMGALRAEATRLGRSTIFTATEVGNAMETLARAGLSGGEVGQGIEPVLRAAAAGGAGIEETAKVVIASIKGMGLEFSDTKRVADTFALVASSAKTTIIELGEGLSKVAPVARQFGMRFEDVVATVATLQDAGVEASMSGTQLKTMLTKLAMLTPKATKRFKQLGIVIGDGNGNMKTMPKLIAAISEGLAKAGGNMNKVKAIAMAVGLRGSTAANLLASAWERGALPDLLQKIADKANNAATQMDKLRQNTLVGDLVKLKSAWEGFRIDIATGSLTELRDVTKSITKWLADPKNIAWAAEKLNDAVDGLDSFWARNGDAMKSLAKTSYETSVLLMEGILLLAKVLPSPTGFLRGMFGSDFDEETNRRATEFERTGVLPPREDGLQPITVKHMGELHTVDAASGILYIELSDELKPKPDPSVYGELGVGPFSIKLRGGAGDFSEPEPAH